MNDLTGELSREQSMVLATMAHQYFASGVWPIWQFVVTTMDRHDLDAEQLIRSLPRVGSTGPFGPSYGLTSPVGPHLADGDRPALTIAACLHLTELQPYLADPFLRVLQTMITMQRTAPVSTEEATRPRFGASDIARELPGLPADFPAKLPGILALEPATWGGSSGTEADGSWWRELHRDIRKYRDAKTLQEYVSTTVQIITAQTEEMFQDPGLPGLTPEPVASPHLYIDTDLIDDLEAKVTAFRLDKLLALVRELNANYADQHPYACQMLLRAILDHVPPAFGQDKFDGVVNNVPWGKTDRGYVKRLSDFRKPADDVLHRPIGTRPSRIDMHDLPPRSYVNALLQGVLDHLPVPQPQGS